MPALTLYHAIPSRSSIVRWMLEEVGAPYDVHLLDLEAGDSRKADYVAVNPMGKVPALRHDDIVVTEAAAICCYLADAFPQAGLAPAIDDPRRGPYLKWLFFAPGCIEPAVIDRAFKRADVPPVSALGYGDYDRVMDVVAAAVAEGPFLLGDMFTAADVVVGANLRWGMAFKLVPERPEFVAYAARLAERPAAQRAEAKDAESTAAR